MCGFTAWSMRKPRPASVESSIDGLSQRLSSKKFTPSARSCGKASGHAPITTDGKTSWPSSRTEPLPVETAGLSVSSGVVSAYGSVALRPSVAFAFTQSLYVVDHASPLTVAV